MGNATFPKNKAIHNVSGLLLRVTFLRFSDLSLFINCIPGISIGVFISLILEIILSHTAIKKHQEDSYFNPENNL